MRLFILFFSGISWCFSQIHVRGSEVAYPLVHEIAKGFQESNKDFSVLVSSTSNNLGFLSVREGQTDIAMSCRPVRTAEVLKFEEKKLKLIETPIAIEPIVMVVSNHSKIKKITFSDVRQIYAGKISNWSSIQQDVSGKIDILCLDTKDPLQSFLEDILPLEENKENLPKTLPNIAEAHKELSKNSHAIAFVPLSYFKAHHKHLHVVSISFDDNIYFDVEKIESDLQAYPLSRQIYFYHVKKDENLDRFLAFIKSERGQKIVNNNGYYPVQN